MGSNPAPSAIFEDSIPSGSCTLLSINKLGDDDDEGLIPKLSTILRKRVIIGSRTVLKTVGA